MEKKVGSIFHSQFPSASFEPEMVIEVKHLLQQLFPGIKFERNGEFDPTTESMLDAFRVKIGIQHHLEPNAEAIHLLRATVEQLNIQRSKSGAQPPTSEAGSAGMLPQSAPMRGDSRRTQSDMFQQEIHRRLQPGDKEASASTSGLAQGKRSRWDEDSDEEKSLVPPPSQRTGLPAASSSDVDAPYSLFQVPMDKDAYLRGLMQQAASSAPNLRTEGRVLVLDRKRIACAAVSDPLRNGAELQSQFFPNGARSHVVFNDNCVQASGQTVFSSMGIQKEFKAFDGAAEDPASTLERNGFQQIGYEQFHQLLFGQRFYAWVNGPSLDGTRQHAYCVTQYPGHEDLLLAWDPDGGRIRTIRVDNPAFFDSIYVLKTK